MVEIKWDTKFSKIICQIVEYFSGIFISCRTNFHVKGSSSWVRFEDFSYHGHPRIAINNSHFQNFIQLYSPLKEKIHFNFQTVKLNSKQSNLTSSKFFLENWKKDSRNLSLTCVCSSTKHSWMFFKTSGLSWEQIEPPAHESVLVPSLLWSQSDVSESLTFDAIFVFPPCTFRSN